MKSFKCVSIVLLVCAVTSVLSWVPSHSSMKTTQISAVAGNLHGQNACFLPIQSSDDDYHFPRIVQIAGMYPGLTKDEFLAVTSDPAAPAGQWTYDFSDPEGPQVGTVALPGSETLTKVEDPVVIIAEHQSIGISLPSTITDPVDIIVLVDRAIQTFSERKFLVYETPDKGLQIGAFNEKKEIPPKSSILGRVVLVFTPFLPSMQSSKTGFQEADEYF